MRAFRLYIRLFLCISLSFLWMDGASRAWAGPEGQKYASIAVDADTREVLHARQIDQPRFPASLTKMMTLYLTFEAIEGGRLSLDQPLVVSARAARAAPVKLGLRAGDTITVHEAIQALAVRSANDVAIVLAEEIGGSEDGFAMMMTAKAQSLGMMSTTYKNASGLPNPDQITTARDQAKLADQLLTRYRKYYHYFGQETFTWRGRAIRNHNKLLGKIDGVDGLKTGYTNASGYNLALSAQRDGRRIIAIVMGGASGTARDDHMERLVDRAFEVQAQRRIQIAENATEERAQLAAPVTSFTLRGKASEPRRVVIGKAAHKLPDQSGRWAVELGAFADQGQAMATLQAIWPTASDLPAPAATPHIGGVFRARLTGLNPENAQSICRDLLSRGQRCRLIAPSG